MTSEIIQEKPVPAVLSSQIEMGRIDLYVSNLNKQKTFYTELVGLEIISESTECVILGDDSREILKLISSDLPKAADNAAGLYHLAIVFESRSTLANVLNNILTVQQTYFTGSADHLVSEAFYFTDPENNGVELYFDRNPTTWQWIRGKVAMHSVYIDPVKYIEQHCMDSGSIHKKLGHIHLKVGNIIHATHFYQDILGLAITAEMASALFTSDGTYHHHIGMNTWESFGVGKRVATLGLKSGEIIIPQKESLVALKNRLQTHSVDFSEKENQVTIEDPWGNILTVLQNSAYFVK